MATKAKAHKAQAVPALPRSNARLRCDPSGALRDEHGRIVILRGLCVGGRSKYAPFFPFPVRGDEDPQEFRAKADAFFAPMRAWGFNVARLTFSWEALEPAPGRLDELYLARYGAMVDSLWALGIGSILDFHQDVYAGCFSGDGFPLWTLPPEDQGPSRHDEAGWFMGYVMDPKVQRAFDRFWRDEDGIQTAFVAMWRHVARRFAGHPGVVGLEIINEPGWGSTWDLDAWKREVLGPFLTRVGAALREACAEAPLLFFGGPGIDALGIAEVHPEPEGQGWVYAPHLYDANLIRGLAWGGYGPEDALEALYRHREASGRPVLIGEFGYGRDAAGGREWLGRVLAKMDALGFSGTLWEYSINEELWNEEDLSVVRPDGTERACLGEFVRPWMRAAGGERPAFDWRGGHRTSESSNAHDGYGTVLWASTGAVTEIVFPKRRFPKGPKKISMFATQQARMDPEISQQIKHTWDAGEGVWRIQAPAGWDICAQFFA